MATSLLRAIFIPANPEQNISINEIESSREQYEWLVAGSVRTIKLFRTECLLYTNKAQSIQRRHLNERATLILHYNSPQRAPDEVVTGDAFILGNNSTHAPKELVRVLTDGIHLRVEACFSDLWIRQTVVYDTWQDAYQAAIATTELWEGQVGVRVTPA
jgi:hypothetical protein